MDTETSVFNGKLKEVLLDLHQHPYPYLGSPPNVPKRASVALILRINPTYDHWPSATNSSLESPAEQTITSRVESFFAEDWVKCGQAEALFIKRAARKGDRWTGHIAFPGGKRDPEDEDDIAAAVRETMEEVGIDLRNESVLQVGNLPQRLVTSSWGTVPLLTLCPYIFLLTSHGIPPLRLQPTEIASAHWVPLKMLLAPANRAYEYQDISSRLANQEVGLKRYYYRITLGRMLFSAVRLMPSESLVSEPPNGPEYAQSQTDTLASTMNWLGISKAHPTAPDLLLWGLTLGVMADFLDFITPKDSLELWTHLWTYPTFSLPDIRLWLWAIGYGFRTEKYRLIQDKPYCTEPASIEVGLDSMPMPKHGVRTRGVGFKDAAGHRGSRSSRVGFMLDGYYDVIRRSIATAFITRTVAIAAVGILVYNRYRRQ